MTKLQNSNDLKKWLLATSDFGQEIQEDINTVIGHNENFNSAVIRCALDLKNAGTFKNPNPLAVTFCDIKKFDVQNPTIGKITNQIKASKLTEDQITNNILMKDEIAKIENRLQELKKPINKNDDDDDDDGRDGGGGNASRAAAIAIPVLADEAARLKDKLDELRGRDRLDELPGRDTKPRPRPRPRPQPQDLSPPQVQNMNN